MPPPEESVRLRENIDEQFAQLRFKMGSSLIAGALLSDAVKQQILKTGLRGAPRASVLVGLGLFGLKRLGALTEGG